MKNILIESRNDTFFTPYVNLNAETGICEMSGESYLEDTNVFYQPIYQWLQEYAREIKKPLRFNFRLTYFNTSSSKSLLDLLRIIRIYEEEGGEVEVNWYYADDDDDMREEAEDFMIDTELQMNLISYEYEDEEEEEDY